MRGPARLSPTAGYVLIGLALGSALVPLSPLAEALPIWKHHLVHGLILALASVAGVLFEHASVRAPADRHEVGSGVWVIVSVLAPVFSMFLMWPTTYDWLEQHPLAHGAEHFCFVGLGFFAGFGGERYVRGVGWMSATATVLTAVVAAAGFGVVLGR